MLPALAARCDPDVDEESGSRSWAEPQRYGTAESRRSFRHYWTDSEIHPFGHRDFPHFHRLRTGLDTRYSRCQKSIPKLQAGPLYLRLKLLCTGEAGRTLFTLGLKSRALGNWAFSLGGLPDPRDLFRNPGLANPGERGRSLAGTNPGARVGPPGLAHLGPDRSRCRRPGPDLLRTGAT